jgi:hypothetical protein
MDLRGRLPGKVLFLISCQSIPQLLRPTPKGAQP